MTLLELIANKGNYRKVGSRYIGPCPKEGGSEGKSFVTKIGSETGTCFSCGWSCDLIGYLREMEGLSCKQAHLQIGRECDKPACPAFEKCRGEKPKKKNNLETPVLKAETNNSHIPAPATEPLSTWQEKAVVLTTWAHGQLMASPEKLHYLAGRGLDLAAVQKYRLGYISKDIYRPRTAWGLPEELKEDNSAKKLWIPAGILIPYFDTTGSVHRIRIRKEKLFNEKDARYYWLPGSGNDVAVLSPGKKAVISVESDLDGLLIDHLAGDIVSTIPLGTCTVRPRENTMPHLTAAAVILVALDNDPAGDKNCIWWQENFEQAVKLPVTAGKDPGEAWQKGVDLRQWILSALPISLHPAKQAEKQAPAGTETATAPAVFAAKTADGRDFLITDDPAEYDRLSKEGHIVFSGQEIAVIKRACITKEQAGQLFDLKEQLKTVFTCATIEKLVPVIKTPAE